MNKKVYDAFMDSLNRKVQREIRDINITEGVVIHALVNFHKWDDGAPVLKYFDRERNHGILKLRKGQKIRVIHNKEDGLIYTYKDGVWYRFDDSDLYIEGE